MTPPTTTPAAAPTCDVGIVGGGPAGLSAALILGRCRRRVVVFDSGKPRNLASRALHGYLTRDGTHPVELRGLGRRQLATYPSVEVRDVEVSAARRDAHGFLVRASDGTETAARFLLLATGRRDDVPPAPGFAALYGHGVYHCPYCDGWEHRDETIVVHGHGENAFDEALLLLTWSARVIICSDGPGHFTGEQLRVLRGRRIDVIESRIAALHGDADGMLETIAFHDRAPLRCSALFFCSDCEQRSSLPENLGCAFDHDGNVLCNGHAATTVPGLYVAGNVRGGVHLAIVAAAEGAEAAVAINRALLEADLRSTVDGAAAPSPRCA